MIGITNKYYLKTAGVVGALALALGTYTNSKMNQFGPHLDDSAFMQARGMYESAQDLEQTVLRQARERARSNAPHTPGFGTSFKRQMDVVDAMYAKTYAIIPQQTFAPRYEKFDSDLGGAALGLIGTAGFGLMALGYGIRSIGIKPKEKPPRKQLPADNTQPDAEKKPAIDLEIMN